MLKKIIRFSTSYVAIEALQKGLMFFLMSVFTFYMTTEEYGVVSSALMLIQFLAIIFSLSLTSSISRYYFKFQSNKKRLKDFLGSSFILLFLIGFSFFIFFLVFGEFLISRIFPELPYNPYLVWIFIICLIQPFNMAYLALLKAQQRIKKYALLYSAFYTVQFALMVVAIVNRDMKQDGYILSLLWSNVFFMFIVCWYLGREINFTLKKKYVKLSLDYSIPFLPAELFNTINALIDRFYILGLLSLSALGVYQIGIQIGAIVVLVTRALNYAYLPHFMNIFESKEKNYAKINEFANYFVLATVVLAGYISLLSPYFIEFFLDKSFIGARSIIIFIIFMYALNSIYFINVNVLSLTPKLVRLKTVFLIVGGVINLFLNYFLIKAYGLTGAAIATFAGFGMTNVLLIYAVEKRTDFNFSGFKNLTYIVISFFIALLVQKLSFGTILLDIITMLVSFTILAFTLFIFMHKIEVKKILNSMIK